MYFVRATARSSFESKTFTFFPSHFSVAILVSATITFVLHPNPLDFVATTKAPSKTVELARVFNTIGLERTTKRSTKCDGIWKKKAECGARWINGERKMDLEY
ncbi:hypothetical protein SLA2020_360010 [Shorea laevis]